MKDSKRTGVQCLVVGIIALTALFVSLPPVELKGQAPIIPTTPYTRTLLRAVDAAAARTTLGVVGAGVTNSFELTQFIITNGTVVAKGGFAVTNITLNSATANRVLLVDSNNVVIPHANVDYSDLTYIQNLSSDAETAINQKLATNNGTAYNLTIGGLGETNSVVAFNGSNQLIDTRVSTNELDTLNGISTSQSIESRLAGLEGSGMGGGSGMVLLTNLADLATWTGLTNANVTFYAVKDNGFWERETNNGVTNATERIVSLVDTQYISVKQMQLSFYPENLSDIGEVTLQAGVTNQIPYWVSTNGVSSMVFYPSDTVNVRMHGAVPGDSIDDSAAFNSAITDALATGKGVVEIPAGTWDIDATINLTNGVSLIGAQHIGLGGASDTFSGGAHISSGITNGDPIIKVQGTILDGIEIRDLSITGTGTDGDGIQIANTANIEHMRLSDIVMRDVGGDGIDVQSSNTGFHQSLVERVKVYNSGGDAFHFASGNSTSVGTQFRNLYANNAGLTSFHFNGFGGFYAIGLTENNAAQHGGGDGFTLTDVREATFIDCTAEGDGRTDDSGFSNAATGFNAAGWLLDGCRQSTFINCVGTQAVGNPTTPGSHGQLVAQQSVGGTFSENNVFVNCRFTVFSNVGAPSLALAGAGAGNLSAGIYSYRVSHVYSDFSWPPNASTVAQRNVADPATDGQMSVTSIPVATTRGSSTPSTKNVWRTEAGGSTYYLVTNIVNATTSFTDNMSDATLVGQTAFTNHNHVKLTAQARNNDFTKTLFTQEPSVTDAGLRNFFVHNFQDNKADNLLETKSYVAGGSMTMENLSLDVQETLTTRSNLVARKFVAIGEELSPSASLRFQAAVHDLVLGATSGADGYRTNETTKTANYFGAPYTNSLAPNTIIRSTGGQSSTPLEIGGGTTDGTPATSILFYTTNVVQPNAIGQLAWQIEGDQDLTPGVDNQFNLGTSTLKPRSVNVSSGFGVGVVGSSTYGIDSSHRVSRFGSDDGADYTRTDATSKSHKFVQRHYTNAEQDLMGLYMFSSSGNSILYYGGGSSAQNAATQHRVHTAADTTTLTGTESARIDHSTTAGETRLMLWDVDNNTLERVTVGAADSGGAGFKVLRIPN